MVRRVIAVAMGLCLTAQVALAGEEGSYWADAGYGVLAVVANVFYMPAKIVYASLGTLTGGLAYVLTVGDDETAQKVWSPSLGGTYVVSPAILRGDEPLLFNGPSYE
jgi:hypothetical protein